MNRYFFKDVFQIGWMCEPIIGCSVGCCYCNTFKGAKRRGWVKTRKEWMVPQIDKIDTGVFEKELQNIIGDIKNNKAINFIALCGTTDAFCNNKTIETFYLCKSIIEKYNIITRVWTKSKIPHDYGKLNPKTSEIGITIDSFELYDKHLKNDNIKMLETLKESGFCTFIALHPLDVKLSFSKLQYILQKLIFVNNISFGILDEYNPNIHKKQFEIAYKYSDYIANFCEKNKINFRNGGYYFSIENKKRLQEKGIIKQILYTN
jgi:DNA repair photolyase